MPDSFDFLHTRRGLLKRVRQEVENVKLPGVRATMPQGREGSRLREVASGNDSRSQRILSTVLSDLAPETVLDIGRDGHCMDYPLMAARYASRVVAVNSDEYRVRRMYGLAKTHNTPILSLQIDFFSPSCDLSNYWFRPVSDRLRCDMVLALDLLDCLVRQNIRFDLITERLSSLSKRWLLVDYVPQPNERRADPDRFPYTWTALDTLITELRKRFRTVSTVPSQAESRVFLLCEK